MNMVPCISNIYLVLHFAFFLHIVYIQYGLIVHVCIIIVHDDDECDGDDDDDMDDDDGDD